MRKDLEPSKGKNLEATRRSGGSAIDQLKADGYRIKVSHLRCSEKDLAMLQRMRIRLIDDLKFVANKETIKEEGDPIAPRGGFTVVAILKDDNVIAAGQAVCHPGDKFSKKLGRDIALGRAVKAFNVATKYRGGS